MATQQQAGATGSAVGGAAGAAIGSIVPGAGTLVGGMIGSSIGGSIGGMFGQNQAPGYSKGDLDYIASQRSQQIGNFSNQLAQARQQYYETTLPNYQKYAMSRFMPQIESNLAGRGLQLSGGAFGSALARQAGDFQAQQSLGQYQDTRGDINNINNAYGQLAGAQLGGGFQNMQNPAPNNNMANLTGQLGQIGAGMYGQQQNAMGTQNFANALASQQGQYIPGSSYSPQGPWRNNAYSGSVTGQ